MLAGAGRGPDVRRSGYDDRVRRRRRLPTRSAGRHRAVVIGLPLLALAVVIGAGLVGRLQPAVGRRLGRRQPRLDPAGEHARRRSSDGSRAAGRGRPAARSCRRRSSTRRATASRRTTRPGPAVLRRRPVDRLVDRGLPGLGRTSATSRTASGILYDLGSRAVARRRHGHHRRTPGRHRGDPHRRRPADGTLDSFTRRGLRHGRRAPPTCTFDKPVTSRYVLVWITGLVPSNGGVLAPTSPRSPSTRAG